MRKCQKVFIEKFSKKTLVVEIKEHRRGAKTSTWPQRIVKYINIIRLLGEREHLLNFKGKYTYVLDCLLTEQSLTLLKVSN